MTSRQWQYQAIGMMHCNNDIDPKYKNKYYLEGYGLQYELEQMETVYCEQSNPKNAA